MATTRNNTKGGMGRGMKSPDFKFFHDAELDGGELPKKTPGRRSMPVDKENSNANDKMTLRTRAKGQATVVSLSSSVTYNALKDLGMKSSPSVRNIFQPLDNNMRQPRIAVKDLMKEFEREPVPTPSRRQRGSPWSPIRETEVGDTTVVVGEEQYGSPSLTDLDGFTPLRTDPHALELEVTPDRERHVYRTYDDMQETPATARAPSVPGTPATMSVTPVGSVRAHAVAMTPVPPSVGAHEVEITPAPPSVGAHAVEITPAPPSVGAHAVEVTPALSVAAHAVEITPAPPSESVSAHSVAVTPAMATPVAVSSSGLVVSAPAPAPSEFPGPEETGKAGEEGKLEGGEGAVPAESEGLGRGAALRRAVQRMVPVGRKVEELLRSNKQLLVLLVLGAHLVLKNRRLMLERQPPHPLPKRNQRFRPGGVTLLVGAKANNAAKSGAQQKKKAPATPAPTKPPAAAAAAPVAAKPAGTLGPSPLNTGSKEHMFMG